MSGRTVLMDVTRLIASGWAGRSSTGIDRVCDAYLAHYRDRALAVVQHKGIFRILSERKSANLFDLLSDRGARFRSRFGKLVPSILSSRTKRADCSGNVYLNVSHTDYDLSDHQNWLVRCNLKPLYFIHDLIPLDHPEYCRPHAVRRHRGRVVNALRSGAGIIVNSHGTAKSLRAFARKRSLPVPPIISAHLGVETRSAPLKRLSATGSHFVYVSTVEPRKNHLMLLRVWRRLIATRDHVPELIFIGRWGHQSAPVRQFLQTDPFLSSHVKVLDRCTDDEMNEWVATARAALIPSLAEGFGLPLLEAMALGVPVLASDLPCFRETGQGIPKLIPSHDEVAWEGAISHLLETEDEVQRQRSLLSAFSPPAWDEHFALVDTMVERLAQKNQTELAGFASACATSQVLSSPTSVSTSPFVPQAN